MHIELKPKRNNWYALDSKDKDYYSRSLNQMFSAALLGGFIIVDPNTQIVRLLKDLPYLLL